MHQPQAKDSASVVSAAGFEPFEPHRLLRSGHLQTIAGRYWPARRGPLFSTYHEVELEDGDRLALLESMPLGRAGRQPTALMVHGLAGCARSPYVVRLARKLVDAGYRVVRMNLRGAGLGFGLARGSYHAGRTEDVRAAAEWAARRAPGAPLALVGFSLGGNLVLKLAAEAAEKPLDGLDCVLTANPPIDLAACCRHIGRPENRLYDRNFVHLLRTEVNRLHARFPELGAVDLSQIRSLYDFDDVYTAQRHGFGSAAAYYERCSAGPLLERITVPGLVVHAEDDPFIPPEPFRRHRFPHHLALELNSSGGHLGYISRARTGGDRHWLDARLLGWLRERWGGSVRDGSGDHCDRASLSRPRGGPHPHVRHEQL
jgi:predicted alpha/beta-fold hydrolase